VTMRCGKRCWWRNIEVVWEDCWELPLYVCNSLNFLQFQIIKRYPFWEFGCCLMGFGIWLCFGEGIYLCGKRECWRICYWCWRKSFVPNKRIIGSGHRRIIVCFW